MKLKCYAVKYVNIFFRNPLNSLKLFAFGQCNFHSLILSSYLEKLSKKYEYI